MSSSKSISCGVTVLSSVLLTAGQTPAFCSEEQLQLNYTGEALDQIIPIPKQEENKNIKMMPGSSNRLKQKKVVRLHIARGSVLDFVGDAFVNAANEGCVAGFGLDEQVNKSGGYQLKEARKRLNGCLTGQAKLTKSFEHLNTNYIIHAVGPVFRENRINTSNTTPGNLDLLLASAYRNALQIAMQQDDIRSVAFCLLSTGVFRGDHQLAELCEIAICSIRDGIIDEPWKTTENCEATEHGDEITRRSNNCLEDVYIVAYTYEEQRALEQAFINVFSRPS